MSTATEETAAMYRSIQGMMDESRMFNLGQRGRPQETTSANSTLHSPPVSMPVGSHRYIPCGVHAHVETQDRCHGHGLLPRPIRSHLPIGDSGIPALLATFIRKLQENIQD